MEYDQVLDMFTVNILAGDKEGAQAQFDTLMTAKLDAALDAERQKLAGTMFKGPSEE